MLAVERVTAAWETRPRASSRDQSGSKLPHSTAPAALNPCVFTGVFVQCPRNRCTNNLGGAHMVAFAMCATVNCGIHRQTRDECATHEVRRGVGYSYLSATIGSTWVARRVGMYAASAATPPNVAEAMANVSRSVGFTP